MNRLSREMSDLVRGELQLAKAETTEKAKQAGIGVGLFGVAGIVALYGGGVLIATAILALALVLDAWLAALIMAVLLLGIAGIAALLGKKQVTEATPPVPTQAIEGIQRDVDVVKNRGNS